MKKHTTINIKTAVILFGIIMAIKMIDAIPWWGFIVPVLAFGMFAGVKSWIVSGFSTGFVTGFVIWAGANLFYHLTFDGNLVSRVGAGLGIMVWIASGLVGGLLTGLAFYTGQQVMKAKNEVITV